MEPIEPDAVYTATQALPLSSVSYARFVAALERGILPNRRMGRAYQIAGRDLLAWRERIRAGTEMPSPERVVPGVRMEVVEMLQWLTDDEVRDVPATIRRLIKERKP
jgi:hypothetical protein